MSTPFGEPPKLFIPGQASPPQGSQQLHIANRSGVVQYTRTIPPASADPGFFKQLITQIKIHSRPVATGVTVAGFAVVGGALILAALANVGNPWLFSHRRDTWKEMLGQLKGNAWDVWLGYFSNLPPYWKGHAVEMLQQYLRFKLIGMFDQLGAIAKDISSAMHNQYKEVLEYDLSLVGLVAPAAAIFKVLTPLSGTPLGRAALITHSGAFLGAIGTLLKQFYDIYNKYETSLNDLELKLTEVKGAFYNTGDPGRGARDLHVDPMVKNIRMWEPAAEEKS